MGTDAPHESHSKVESENEKLIASIADEQVFGAPQPSAAPVQKPSEPQQEDADELAKTIESVLNKTRASEPASGEAAVGLISRDLNAYLSKEIARLHNDIDELTHESELLNDILRKHNTLLKAVKYATDNGLKNDAATALMQLREVERERMQLESMEADALTDIRDTLKDIKASQVLGKLEHAEAPRLNALLEKYIQLVGAMASKRKIAR